MALKPPTKAQFEEYVRLCRAFPNRVSEISDANGWQVELTDEMLRADGVTLNVVALSDLIEKIGNIKNQLKAEIALQPVDKWLLKQPRTPRAVSRLFGPAAMRSTPDEVATDIVAKSTRIRTAADFSNESPETVQTRVEEANRPSTVKRRASQYLRRAAWHNPMKMAGGIAEAFGFYFHTDRYLVLLNEGRNAEQSARKALRAAETLTALSATAELVPIELGGMGQRALARVAEDLRKFLAVHDPKKTLPVRRDDKTAPERQLAYDLWRVFSSEYGANKTLAIATFLEFDGIKEPLNLRSIEDLVKHWNSIPRW